MHDAGAWFMGTGRYGLETRSKAKMKGQLSLSVRRRPNQVYRNPHASATSRVGVSAFPGLALKEWREGQDELDWARNSVAYQIFADRFAPHPDQGHQSDTGLQLAPWGSTPTLRDFQVTTRDTATRVTKLLPILVHG